MLLEVSQASGKAEQAPGALVQPEVEVGACALACASAWPLGLRLCPRHT